MKKEKHNEKTTSNNKLNNNMSRWKFLLGLVPLVGIGVYVFIFLSVCGVVDWGSFLGGLLAYLGTVILGCVTVWQNEKLRDETAKKDERRDREIKESQRREVMPYLFSESNVLSLDAINEFVSEQRCIQFEKENDTCGICDYVPFEIAKCNSNGNISFSNLERFIFIKYSLENIGQASAANVLLFLNGKQTFEPFAIGKSTVKVVYILVDMGENFNGEYKVNLSFLYNDIQGETQYVQNDTIVIKRLQDDTDPYLKLLPKESISTPKIHTQL